MQSWNDFNSAEDQKSFEIIPRGTLAKVRMTIKPGGYDDPNQGWTGGYATCSQTTGSVYLYCEFVITEGPYAKRKVWSLIGLSSPKGPEWGDMGRSMIKGILNSANRLMPDDQSPAAQQARRIPGLNALDGIEFIAQISVEKDQYDDPKNVIKAAITPDHNDYATMINGGQVSATQPQSATSTAPPVAATQTASAPVNGAAPATTAPTGKPAWAQ